MLSGSEGGGGNMSMGRSTKSHPSKSASFLSPPLDACRARPPTDLSTGAVDFKSPESRFAASRCGALAAAFAAVRDSAITSPACRVKDACAQEAVPSTGMDARNSGVDLSSERGGQNKGDLKAFQRIHSSKLPVSYRRGNVELACPVRTCRSSKDE
jgi:hypothetical protein